MQHPDFSIQFEAFGIRDDIPFETQFALYRIAQESIYNVVKYAKAQYVIVQLSQDKGRLSLTVEDDGIGFDMENIKLGMGLKNMKNRARLIKAELVVSSVLGEGTSINVDCDAG